MLHRNDLGNKIFEEMPKLGSIYLAFPGGEGEPFIFRELGNMLLI